MKSNNARKVTVIEPIQALETQKLRVAAYARVSSDSADQLNSFATQVSYYTRLIEENERWELVEVYADEGVTGVSTEKRTEFNRMIEDCRQGKIHRILTKSVSRFARNTLDSINTLRELKSYGVTVLFEKEGIDTKNLSGESLVTLYSMFAQQESVSISQNCKKGARMRMEAGTYVASNAPYGYRLVNKQLEIYEPEAEIVRRIFKEYLRGKGVSYIARGLTLDKIPTKAGNQEWKYPVVLKLLKNERYIGDVLLQKEFCNDALPYKETKNIGQLPKYYIENTHEPIVSKIQFELVKILIQEKSIPRIPKYYVSPLSKKIQCKSCGTLYRGKTTNRITYWTCRTHDADGASCPSQRIPEEAVYEAFFRMYNKLKENSEGILTPLLTQLEKLRERSCLDSAELSAINKQIADTAQQNQVMTGLLSKGILDSALFISQSNEFKTKLQKLKQQKARLLTDVKKDTLLTKIEELLEILENGPDFITEMDEDLFGDLVEQIEAQDNRSIDFILRGGLRLKERL